MRHCYKHFTCVINNSHKHPRRVDFPGGPVVENLPANAGHVCSIPGGEDPTCQRATKLMAATTEAGAREPVLHKRNHRNEKPAH